MYLKLSQDPEDDEIKKVNRLFDCFRSSAFQIGLFMAFAYMKVKMGIYDKQEFADYVAKWITRINKKFQNTEGVRMILFDYSNTKSLRCLYKPTDELSMYWDALLAEIPDLDKSPPLMRVHEIEEVEDEDMTDHLLFWPIGQQMLAEIDERRGATT